MPAFLGPLADLAAQIGAGEASPLRPVSFAAYLDPANFGAPAVDGEATPTPTPTARLSGTVTATDGTAVPGATVLVCDAAGAWACDESLTSASGAYTSGTLTDGTYLLQVVPLEPNPVDALPGWYRNAPPANYATSAATATSIAIAGSSQTISLQLPRGSRFRGRVSASDGVAVPGARITPCLAATPTTCSGACASSRRRSRRASRRLSGSSSRR